jgi:nucleoside-diphosphate-sugar epimerase
MKHALIGHSGFVGTTLLKQCAFDARYRSTDIDDIRGRSFELVVCAAAPAQKWIANREPEQDLRNIERLMDVLSRVSCGRFVLISTVDVFGAPSAVTEASPVEEAGLHPYGLHRRLLEKFVAERFREHLVVRLPGLVGPGLRKNVIFDFLNENNLAAVESRNQFQFYPTVNLWHDVDVALRAGLQLVHLTAAPISVADVAEQGFGRPFRQELERPLVDYDMRSQHAELYGASGAYQYTRRETLLAIRAYAQSEPRAATAKVGAT